MDKCININNGKVKEIAAKLGILPVVAATKMAIWMDANNGKIPTINDLLPSPFYQKTFLGPEQEKAKGIYFKDVYNKDLTPSDIAVVNEKLRRLSEKVGDTPWSLRKSSSGNWYIAGYKNGAVTSGEYYSPFGNGNFNQLINEEGKIALEKTIRDLTARIADRIGINYKIITDPNQKFKGKLNGNVATINLAYATLDTPIHEILGHPIIRAIKGNNTYTINKTPIILEKGIIPLDGRDGYKYEVFTNSKNGKEFKTEEEAKSYIESQKNQLYQNLLKELETGRGKEVLDRIKRDYQYKESEYSQEEQEIAKKVIDTYKKLGKTPSEKELRIAENKRLKYTLEEQQEEAIVELLGLMTAGKLNVSKDGKLISLLKRLLKEMKAFVKALIGQKEVEIDKLPDNMTMEDLSDILAYSNGKLLLPGYGVEYTTPDNQKFKSYAEASKHISDLAKSIEDVDLDNVKLGGNQEVPEDLKWEFENQGKTYKELIENKQWKISDDTGNTQIVANQEYNGKIGGLYWDGNNYYHSSNIDGKKTIIPFNEFIEYFSKIKQFGIINKDKLFQDRIVELSKYEQGKINPFKEFINKNKEYEQVKEIIEEWKKVNNIQYNPEEIYSRGQEFSSVVGAYSDFDINLMMQNLLQHIEDNKKAGGQFAISAYTKPVDKTIGHLEGGGGKIKFKIYPQSNDILWAANTDVYSGSVWDASEKVNANKKSELLGVSYTKYPSLQNVNSIQPNLASIVDNLAHHHNELGIVLTGNNFRLEYDDDIPYSTKKIIDGINSILDQKYGKLVKPDINKVQRQAKIRDWRISRADRGNTEQWALEYTSGNNINEYDGDVEFFDTEQEAKDFLKQKQEDSEKQVGIQPTQTNETLKESIKNTQKNVNKQYEETIFHKYNKNDLEIVPYEEQQGYFIIQTKQKNIRGYALDESHNIFKSKDLAETYLEKKYNELNVLKPKPDYNTQAIINTKIAKLKEVAKKYPRSLISSKVVQNKVIVNDPTYYNLEDTVDFQKIPGSSSIQQNTVDKLQSLQGKQTASDTFYTVEGFETQLKRPSSLAKKNIQNKQEYKTDIQEQQENKFMDAGTLLHDMMSEIVRRAFPDANTHRTPMTITPDMASFFEIMNQEMALIIKEAKDNGDVLMSEVFVGNLKSERGGTIDLLSISSEGNYKIYDLKNRFTKDKTILARYNKISEFSRQLEEYKKILEQGDEKLGIPQGKVESVKVLENTVKYDLKTQAITKINGINTIAPDFLRTSDEKINEFINKLQAQIKILADKKPKNELEKETNAKLLASKMQLMQDLQLKQDVNEIINHARLELISIKAYLEDETNLDTSNVMAELSLYADLTEYLEYESLSDEMKTKLRDVMFESKIIKDNFLKRSKEVVIAAAKAADYTGNAKLVEHLFDPAKDINMARKLTTGIAGTDNALVQTGWRTYVAAMEKVSEKMDQMKEKFLGIVEDYKKAVGSLDYSILLNDKQTALVSEQTSEFRDLYYKHRKTFDTAWAKENLIYDQEAYNKAYEDFEAYQDKYKKQNIEKIKVNLMAKGMGTDEADRSSYEIYMASRKADRDAWLAKNKNNPYAYYKAKDKWTDPKWKEIKHGKYKGTAVEKFYDFYSNYMKVANEVAPEHIRPGFIPNFTQDFLTRASNLGVIGAIKGSWSELLNELSLEYDENLYGKLDPITGEQMRELFIPGMSKARQDKSLDLGKSLLMFMEGVYRYDELSKIEATLGHIKYQLRTVNEQMFDSQGNPISGETRISTKPNPSKNISDQFEYFLDSAIYGRKQKDEGSFKFKGNGFTEAIGLLKKGDEKIIAYAKILDKVIRFTGLKNLALNMYAPVVNLLGGTANMYMTGAGGIDYTSEDLTKAIGLITAGKFKFNTEEGLKARLILDWLKIEKEKIDREIFHKVSNAKLSSIVEEYNGMSLMRESESAMVESGAIAMILSGKHSLKMEDFEIKDGKLELKREISPVEKAMFKQKIMRVNNTNIGSMNPDDSLLAKKYMLGRMLMQHRSWLPGLFYTRFGSKQFDYTLERDVEGRYLVAVRAFKAIMQKGVAQGMESLTPEELAAAKASFAEATIILGVFLLYSALHSVDDDDKKEAWYKMSNKISTRVLGELFFFADPTLQSQWQILLSPAASTSTLEEAGKLIRDIVREGTADFYEDPEKIQKKAKPLKRIGKIVPYFSKTQSFLDDLYNVDEEDK